MQRRELRDGGFISQMSWHAFSEKRWYSFIQG